ncbi:His Kinase A (phospho-acceptor) domain-containing protein [Polaromonas sp. YR568]|uniref:sensor histidine kinase n=1 Tax=Polaromonas sp. YR568 TaxID=1855301 RepID=UPI0008E2E15F|nr:ATP-binding protein [Polaromonas sp. YR568]SFU92337.1 His Kinase A (phospho-acceptor) domain-containing protein [Polaromonas sp. YR568]
MQKCGMLNTLKHRWWWLLAWCLITALGCVVMERLALTQLRDAFDTDMRIAHRLLSQRVVQHDAMMATLALLQPQREASPSAQPEQRLVSVYPQILEAQRRDPGASWPRDNLRIAEEKSRQSRHAELADVDFGQGRYQLVLSAHPTSHALLIDLRSTVPWSDWPMAPEQSPVRVSLDYAGQSFLLQPGKLDGSGWRFDFQKHLASESQPFDVVATREVGWSELPWGEMLAWAVLVAALLGTWMTVLGQRAARRRAEELLRLGQVARLNSLGELAAGMAHELNQPLTAVLANTQAAGRLLDDDPPELATARDAMRQAVEQARRASEVVGRLRRAIERPGPAGAIEPVLLQQAVRNALYLLEPEFKRRGVAQPDLEQAGQPHAVLADPVALEQVIHNLLMNALQALEQVAAPQRKLTLALREDKGQGVLSVRDSGPGIPPELLPNIFQPFFTTRDKGLGLGLSLCETLAGNMGGTLTARNAPPHGAEFQLSLPLASAAAGSTGAAS